VDPLAKVLPSVTPLERTLLHYPDVVARAAHEMEPHYLTTYLTELASAFNSWYASGKVIGGPHEQYGIFLTAAVERTLREGLTLLGIPVPEEM
jgi:arginyl-tRNA synthetase